MSASNLRKESEQVVPASSQVRNTILTTLTLLLLATVLFAMVGDVEYFLVSNAAFLFLTLLALVALWKRKVSFFSPVNPWIVVALAIASFFWEMMGLVALRLYR